MNRLLDYIAGYRFFYVSGGSRRLVSSLLIENSIPFTVKNLGDGSMRLKIRLNKVEETRSLLSDGGVDFTVSLQKGLPALLSRIIKRPGYVVGLIMFFVFSWFSSRIVWDIRVTGNGSFTEDEIESILSTEGFSYGTFFERIDFDRLNSSIMANNPDVAWISVNMRGNVAQVDVRKAEHGFIRKEEEGVYANIIANEDAQIVLTRTDKGKPEVSCGDIVKKGDLLISGIVPLRDEGVRFVYAEGEVTADVNRAFSVRVENKVKEKVYTGEKTDDKSVIFFKKNVNLFSNGGIEYTSYDKIDKKDRLFLFGRIPLPVWVRTDEYREFTEREMTLTPEQALSKAKKELRKTSDETLGEADLILKKVTVLPEENGIVLRCEMVCRTDIGETVEFTVSEK